MGRVAYRKYSIGLNLASFIDTEDESTIMETFNMIKNQLPESITIKLWYTEGEVKSSKLGRFMKEWGDLLAEYGSQMYCLTDKNNRSYNAWFNVLTRDEAKKIINVGRFQYYCEDNQKIWMGIFSFLKVVKFHCKDERFETYQKKRSRYEGRDSRKS